MSDPIKSQDPLPLNTIGLSEAYERYYSVTRSDWKNIEDKAEAELAAPRGDGMSDGSEGAYNTYYASRLAAEIEFRHFISAGKARSLILHPVTNERLQPYPLKEWQAKHSFGVPGFHDDFVDPDDLLQPGPSAVIEGRSRRVFFDCEEFDAFLNTIKNDIGYEAGEQESKPGAKPKYDWQDAKEFAHKTFAERGEFKTWDSSGWKSKADLVRLVIDYMTKHDAMPSEPQAKRYVYKWLKEWR